MRASQQRLPGHELLGILDGFSNGNKTMPTDFALLPQTDRELFSLLRALPFAFSFSFVAFPVSVGFLERHVACATLSLPIFTHYTPSLRLLRCPHA